MGEGVNCYENCWHPSTFSKTVLKEFVIVVIIVT